MYRAPDFFISGLYHISKNSGINATTVAPIKSKPETKPETESLRFRFDFALFIIKKIKSPAFEWQGLLKFLFGRNLMILILI